MLNFDQLDEALQQMNVTMHEYSYFLNNGKNDYFIEVFEEIDNAFYLQDRERLEKIYQHYISYKEGRLIALSAKACYGKLEEHEIEEISEYLFTIERWGAKELWIFTDTIDQLTTPLIKELIDEFLIKSQFYQGIVDYNRLIMQAAINAIVTMVDRNEQKKAKRILRQSQKRLWEVDEYSRTLHLFAQGYYDYCFISENQGKEKMRQGLEIFKILGCHHLLSIYQDFYDNRTKSKEI
ncbi:MAG: hypothetical protein LBI13_09820 [Streptococcaceae bacterium]|nr:hypothetical protein [Streptococcaceae bacterium]